MNLIDIRFLLFQLLYNLLFILSNTFLILERKRKIKKYFKLPIWGGYFFLGVFGDFSSDAHVYKFIVENLKFKDSFQIEYIYKVLARVSGYNYRVFMAIILIINIFLLEFLIKKFKIKNQFLFIGIFINFYLLDSINIIRAFQMQLLLIIVAYFYLNNNKVLSFLFQISVLFIQKTGILGLLLYFNGVIKRGKIVKKIPFIILMITILLLSKMFFKNIFENTKYISYIENEQNFGMSWWILIICNYGIKIYLTNFLLKKYYRNNDFYKKFKEIINFQIIGSFILISILLLNLSPYLFTRIFLIFFNFNLILLPKYIEDNKYSHKKIYLRIFVCSVLILILSNVNLIKLMLIKKLYLNL